MPGPSVAVDAASAEFLEPLRGLRDIISKKTGDDPSTPDARILNAIGTLLEDYIADLIAGKGVKGPRDALITQRMATGLLTNVKYLEKASQDPEIKRHCGLAIALLGVIAHRQSPRTME